MSRKLTRAFFARDARAVARALLGKVLVHRHRGRRRAARIVETEAYLGPEDLASHARFGRTRRAAIMFGPPGHAYVYLVYGMHHCANVVTGADGEAQAVLLRAAEPVEGCLDEPRGPGKLCRALGIRRESCDGLDLCGGRLWLEDAPPPPEPVRTSRRVGVRYAGAWAARPWRFYLEGNRFVSRPPGVRPHRTEGRLRRRRAAP